jgi:hypothetical protein
MAAGGASGRLTGSWLELREAVEARLREDGSWSDALAPLADEYAHAARLTQQFRARARRQPFSTSSKTGRTFAHPGHAAADRESRRMMMLARVLGVTRPRRVGSATDTFAELEEMEAPDDLASRRKRREKPERPAS